MALQNLLLEKQPRAEHLLFFGHIFSFTPSQIKVKEKVPKGKEMSRENEKRETTN
jgi:hypothetical protein